MLILKSKRKARRLAGILLIIGLIIIWGIFMYRTYQASQMDWNHKASEYYSVMSYSKAGNLLDREGNAIVTFDDQEQDWIWDESNNNNRAYSTLVGPPLNLTAVSKHTMLGASAAKLLGMDNGFAFNPIKLLSPLPTSGNDVRMTVSTEMQSYAFDLLDDYPTASIFIYNYMTGEVLASVSKPTFNPITLKGLKMDEDGKYVSFSDKQGAGVNKNIAYLRPPGSTMKTVTAAIALDYDDRLADFSCECTGTTTIDGVVIKCHSTHGNVKSMASALDKSCNIYFATLAYQIPDDIYMEGLKNFGFNTVVNYGEFETADGMMGSPDSDGSISQTDKLLGSFGQATCRTTPLQMATIYGYIASGGQSVYPYFFEVDGESHDTINVPDMCSSRACSMLSQMLEDSVNEGNGSKAYIKGMHVMGKSGTAQWGDGREDTAWFIAATQNEDYPFVVCVCLDETSSGGSSAAPLAKKMIKAAIELTDKENGSIDE